MIKCNKVEIEFNLVTDYSKVEIFSSGRGVAS